MRAPDLIVVGGGVVGASVAFHLAREGISVSLLERDGLAAGASGAAAGMLAPIGEAAAPGPLLRLGLLALRGFEGLCEELRERSGIDPQYVSSGALRIALTDDEAQALHARTRAVAGDPELGVELEWLEPAAARALEPTLSFATRGASWSPREGHVLSPVLTRAYAAGAAALGARIETGVPVEGLWCDGDRVLGVRTPTGPRAAGAVVLCAGAWTPGCVGWLPSPRPELLPVVPVRGQIVALEARRPGPGIIVSGTRAYLVPKRDGTLIVGATEEHVGFDCRVTAAGVRGLLDAAPSLLPELASASFRGAWAGLRPGSPDGLPALGAWPGARGLFVAAGHHRNGVLLSAVTGRWVADMVRGKGLPEEACAVALERFAGPAGER
jgi:glycine oxidase